MFFKGKKLALGQQDSVKGICKNIFGGKACSIYSHWTSFDHLYGSDSDNFVML